MRLPPLNAVENLALDHYILWLNTFALRADGPSYFKLERRHFFSDNWAETYHIGDQPTHHHHLYTISAGTGDDGGPAMLYIWGGEDADSKPYVEFIVQEFDTMFSVVYHHAQGGLQC